MALTLNDRVLETCTSPGTGAVTLLGATTGFRTFLAGVGNGNTCYYTIADQSGGSWEVGLGTYTSSSNTLARTTILSSSNSGSLVNFNSGTQNVFVTYPAEKAVYLDASGNVTLTGTLTASAINSTPIGSGTASTGAFTTLSASSTVSGTGFSNYLASPPAIGSGTPNTGAFTTLTASSDFITTLGLYSQGAFSGTYTDGIVLDYVTGRGRISVGSSDGLSIYNGGVAGTALLNLDSAGNLGLGVVPSGWNNGYKTIQVNALAAFSGTNTTTIIGNNWYQNVGASSTYLSTAAATLYIQGSGSHSWYTAPSGTAGSTISFTQAMTLTASGLLGVGTTSPAGKIHGNGEIYWGDGAASYAGFLSYAANEAQIQAKNSGTYALTFYTLGNERMRLTSSGYLGIGTSSPGAYLSVIGAATFGTATPTSGSLLTLQESASNGAALTLINRNSTQKWNIAVDAVSVDDKILAFIDASSSTYRMGLDSSGNLGLGVTPSAWNSGVKAMQISTGAMFSGSGYAYTSQNLVYGAGGDVFLGSGYATAYGQTNGVHKWLVSTVSGTAGNAISFTQAMTLDASGNLLVGATSGSAARFEATAVSGQYAGYFNFPSGGYGIGIKNTSGGSGVLAYFFSPNYVGEINTNGTTTTYASASDQRLKTNVTPAGSAIQSILDFPVDQFDWISTGEHQDFGGVAQKVLPIIPEMVSVPADPDEMWGIDWSKAVPRLIKTIQELHAELQALKATLH